MTTIKLKIKINNSYESEPSSGSGSSASEVNDYEHNFICEDVTSLNSMMNPGFYSMNNNNNHQSKEFDKNLEAYKIKRCENLLDSSEESNFEGFTEEQISPKRVYYKRIEPKSFKCLKNVEKIEQSKVSNIRNCFTTYNDVIIEENSCNAVDMKLSDENYIENSEPSLEPPSELSFNGKIKSLTSEKIEEGNGSQENSKSPKILKGLLETSETSDYKYTNERSPDLFDDDDDNDNEEEDEQTVNGSTIVEEDATLDDVNKSNNCPTESSLADEYNESSNYDNEDAVRNNIRIEKELLKRIKTCLSGIPPPPSFTIPQIDLFSAILSHKDEILNLNNVIDSMPCEEGKGLFVPSHPFDETWDLSWKETLGVRGHGFCYNLCKASESNELLSLAVIERYIGAETSTSYTAKSISSPSSAKKRNLRQKMLTQSSGSRLSHLAKRRAAFSSANLATTMQKPSSTSLGGMQILLDKKKGKSRRKGTTPKRMTPASKKKAGRKTPSSSARKRLFFRVDGSKPGPSRETSKRALFQSPAKQQKLPVVPSRPTFKPEINNRVEKSKRALFSPDKSSQSSVILSSTPECGSLSQASQPNQSIDSLILKRKRTEDDISDIMSQNSKKIFRPETEILTPRSLKIKSQSFCIGAGSINGLNGNGNTLRSNSNLSNSSVFSSSSSNFRSIGRASSDTTFHSSNNLTENHRKKLLWAVSQALQSKQINVTHSNFKQFAAVLARVVRRLFQEYFQKSSTSTSETMLRLAKKYVYNVMAGKGADEIYLYAKSKIDEEKRMSTNRLSGYIAPDEFENRKLVMSQTSFYSFENSMDSLSLSQNSSLCLTQPMQNIRNSQSISMESLNSKSAMKQTIQPNPSLQNSSSKNNLGGIALRENVDCELRRSAQKNFTGKDQRNVSPYANTGGRSSAKKISTFGSNLYELSSTAKAKRQISFDS